MNEAYVHGYQRNENERLQDQAGTLVDLLHSDTSYPAGSLVLEAGCGVGAQTVTLARRSPDARFVSVDVSADSIAQATRAVEGAGLMDMRAAADKAGLTNVQFRPADIFALPFAPESFDHVFVCFVLSGDGARFSAHGVCGFEPTRSRRRLHEEDVHGDDRGYTRGRT